MDQAPTPTPHNPSKSQPKETAPKKKLSKAKIITGSVLGVLVLGGIGNALGGATPPNTETQNTVVKSAAPQPTTKVEEVKKTLPHSTTEKADATLPKGERRTISEGTHGEQTETYEVTYLDGKETGRKLVGATTTREPVNTVVHVGTYVAPTSQPARQSTSTRNETSSSNNAYYKNCTAARNAGVTPIYRGQAGYASHLDRDGDGIACE
ncbi:G5 domain-containing protein [Candidatus Saccharibacteria bacterium TM7i]|nr:G5 domain-containing protein [Candidatus Saccharibacteria bacterium TM7i]